MTPTNPLRKRIFAPEDFKSIEEAAATINTTIESIDAENYSFLSVVFHDLRNPLTYIKMSLDVLTTGSFGEIPPEQKELLDKACLQIDRLNKIIDDVLLISKLEHNKLPMAFSSLNIVNILNDAINTNKPLIENKKLFLNKKIDENIPDTDIDYKSLSIAFNYLINYCVKSTDSGGLSLTCEMDQNNGKIIIALNDTSPQIDKENIPQIFQKFQCFGRMAVHKEERSGLELSISKEIILKHRGEIIFDTDENSGNKFLIKLPL